MVQYAYNTGSNPSYQVQKTQPPVVMQMPDNARPRWSWCSMVWSLISCCCCTTLCGALSVVFALLSYTDHKADDFNRSRSKRNWSWCCSITGIVLFLIWFISMIVLLSMYPGMYSKYYNKLVKYVQ